MKLSHMGIFIRLCLLISLWLSTAFLTRYTLISARMCNYEYSNAVATVTFFTALIMSLLLVCPKRLIKYKIMLYEMLTFCSITNGLMAYYGPGECIPVLSNVLSFAHGLTSFSYGMSLLLMFLAPTSKIGLLTYGDEEKESKRKSVEA